MPVSSASGPRAGPPVLRRAPVRARVAAPPRPDRLHTGALVSTLALGLLLSLLLAVRPAPAADDSWAPPGWSPRADAAATSDEPVLVATRAIPSRTILTESDVALRRSPFGPGLDDVSAVIGQETRVAIYAGRPIRLEDIGPPALVERNERVLLRYVRGALRITAEGRALDRGAEGDWIRAINLSSRQTISGRVAADGVVEVSP